LSRHVVLDTAFYDDVRRSKEHYEHPAIELVAQRNGEIVGLIDVECEEQPGTVCEERPGLGGMIWHLAVHPDHQRRGVATALLRETERRARPHGLGRLEAWTRDDPGSRAWYESSGFELVQSYLNVYIDIDEGLRDRFPITRTACDRSASFAHSVGNPDAMRTFSSVSTKTSSTSCDSLVTPDLELLTEAAGHQPRSWKPVDTGGYTRSQAWRVETRDGPAFVKQAEEAGSLQMLRREAVVYRDVRGPFLPAFVGFADSGERALLAVEYLEDAHWPPPYPDDVGALFAALELVAATPASPELPIEGPNDSQWERIAADPEPFLALGLCSRAWFERSIAALRTAEGRVVVEGDALVHNDIYAANVAFVHGNALLVDWGAAIRGSHGIDVAFALLSLRVEGVTRPSCVVLPDEDAFAATIAGHFAVGASSPLPAWADPDSTFLEDVTGDLAHALQWAAEQLDLQPLS